jgi:hypothetical protein
MGVFFGKAFHAGGVIAAAQQAVVSAIPFHRDFRDEHIHTS